MIMNKFLIYSGFLFFSFYVNAASLNEEVKTDIPKINWEFCKGKREKQSECVVDGDTIRIGYKNYRLKGLDTPEKRSKCQEEKRLAIQASNMTLNELNNAKEIQMIVNIDKLTKTVISDKYGRPMLQLNIDGNDLSKKLIDKGLAKEYQGKTKEKWC